MANQTFQFINDHAEIKQALTLSVKEAEEFLEVLKKEISLIKPLDQL